jgi:lambda family phage tail tape measure protein
MQIDQLATGAINSLSSNLAGLIAGTKTAAEAFKAFATSMIADIAAMIIKLLIYKAIRTAIFGFSEGGAVGGTGFTGGIGGLFADGGNVTGPGTGTSDSIPAMLSDGEFVVNAQATKQWAPLLNAINSGSLPAFADGGNVSQSSAPVQSAPSISKTIVLQGVMWGRDQMRDLFAALNEGMRDGHKLNVQFA